MTARALTSRPARFFLGAGSTALALCLGGAPLVLTSTAHAANAKGSLTVHAEGTAVEDENNEPHVCSFRLVADNYEATDTGITYSFSRIAPSTPQADGLLPGSITLVDGEGQTDLLSLPNGHYKPHGQIVGDENGADNFKAFWVECEDTGGTTGGETTTSTGGETTTSTGGETTTSTGGETTTSTGGETTTSTGGETTTGGETSTGGETTTGDATTGEITGGGTGATVTPTVPKPTLGGGTAAPTANELPHTGGNTGTLALWGLASLVGGIGFMNLGKRQAKPVR